MNSQEKKKLVPVKSKQVSTRRAPKKLSNLPPVAPIKSPYDIPGAKLIYIDKADMMTMDQILRPGVQIFRGNVSFRQDNTYLYCDSAYFYSELNSFDAFSNVRIVQGDTLFIYGDVLYYDGNTKMARLRHNVKMINRNTTLTTDSMNYDRNANLSYFFKGGQIIDKQNNMTSVWGQYAPNTNEAIFREKVHLLNKNFTMDADTLFYNTNSHIAKIQGKTHILYKEETNIYSNKGWYNTETEKSMLLNRSRMVHKDGKTLIGDSIFYDKKAKYGEAFKNVILSDSVEKRNLTGNYIFYNENNKMGIAADSSLLVDWSEKDTFYIHADTLQTFKDSLYNHAKGWYNTRFLRADIQGLCDSLVYSGKDSIIYLYQEPILWHKHNQLSGEFMKVSTKNKKVKQVQIEKSSMVSEQVDSIYFNQISGKDIITYIDSGEIKKVDVNGNAETIYLPIDEADSSRIGVNKTESSFVQMYFKKRFIDRIVLTSASNGTIYPMGQLQGDELYLKNFFWAEERRPKTTADLFLNFPKGPRPRFSSQQATIPNLTPAVPESEITH